MCMFILFDVHNCPCRQTLTLLARLVQEDYIKWKGSLFFRFISTLLDEELRVFGERKNGKKVFPFRELNPGHLGESQVS